MHSARNIDLSESRRTDHKNVTVHGRMQRDMHNFLDEPSFEELSIVPNQ